MEYLVCVLLIILMLLILRTPNKKMKEKQDKQTGFSKPYDADLILPDTLSKKLELLALENLNSGVLGKIEKAASHFNNMPNYKNDYKCLIYAQELLDMGKDLTELSITTEQYETLIQEVDHYFVGRALVPDPTIPMKDLYLPISLESKMLGYVD